jgi:hypothetical protein
MFSQNLDIYTGKEKRVFEIEIVRRIEIMRRIEIRSRAVSNQERQSSMPLKSG